MVYIAGRSNVPVYTAKVQQAVDEVKREMFGLLHARWEAGMASEKYFPRGRGYAHEWSEKRSVRMGIPAETGIDSEDYDVAFGAWYNLAVRKLSVEEPALASPPALLSPNDSGSDSGEGPTLPTAAPATPSPSPRRHTELPQLTPLPETLLRVMQHNPYPIMNLVRNTSPMYCTSVFEVGMPNGYGQHMIRCHSMLFAPMAHRLPSEMFSGASVT